MKTITKEEFEKANILVAEYIKQQKIIEVNNIMEQIKSVYSYPLGIECLDKFSFQSCTFDGSVWKAEVSLPYIYQNIILKITPELANALSRRGRYLRVP